MMGVFSYRRIEFAFTQIKHSKQSQRSEIETSTIRLKLRFLFFEHLPSRPVHNKSIKHLEHVKKHKVPLSSLR